VFKLLWSLVKLLARADEHEPASARLSEVADEITAN